MVEFDYVTDKIGRDVLTNVYDHCVKNKYLWIFSEIDPDKLVMDMKSCEFVDEYDILTFEYCYENKESDISEVNVIDQVYGYLEDLYDTNQSASWQFMLSRYLIINLCIIAKYGLDKHINYPEIYQFDKAETIQCLLEL